MRSVRKARSAKALPPGAMGRRCASAFPLALVRRERAASNSRGRRRMLAQPACSAVARMVGVPGRAIRASRKVVPRASSARTPFPSPYVCPPARLRGVLPASSASLSKRGLRRARGSMDPTAFRPHVPRAPDAWCRQHLRTQARYGWRASRAVVKGARLAKWGGCATAGTACSPAIRRAPKCAPRATPATGRRETCPTHACRTSGVTWPNKGPHLAAATIEWSVTSRIAYRTAIRRAPTCAAKVTSAGRSGTTRPLHDFRSGCRPRLLTRTLHGSLAFRGTSPAPW